MNVQEVTTLRDHIYLEIVFWGDVYFNHNNILNEEEDNHIRLHLQVFLRTVNRLIRQLRFEHQQVQRNIDNILAMRR